MSDSGKVDPYPEKPDSSDYLQPLAKGAAGLVPFAGTFLGEIIERYWAPALVERREEWLRSLSASLNDLVDRVARVEERLRTSPQVLTVAVRAVVAAQETHEREKLDALRFAVLNSALETEPDEQVQLIFVSMVDRLTAAHLQLLNFLHDPVTAFQTRGLQQPKYLSAAISTILEIAFPTWKREFYDRLAADLSLMGLTDAPLHAGMTSAGLWVRRTTPFGERFLKFIAEPPTTSHG